MKPLRKLLALSLQQLFAQPYMLLLLVFELDLYPSDHFFEDFDLHVLIFHLGRCLSQKLLALNLEHSDLVSVVSHFLSQCSILLLQ